MGDSYVDPVSYSPMAERETLSRLSTLALRNRREGLAKLLPPLQEGPARFFDGALSDLR